MAESPPMLFRREFEDLHDDGFEGSMDEKIIFHKVFFGSDSSTSRKNEFVVSEATIIDCKNIKQLDLSLCSNSGKSSLTSQDDYAKAKFSGKCSLEYLSIDLQSSIKSNHEGLSVEDLPDVKPNIGDTPNASAPSEGVASGMSQDNIGSACHTLTYRVVESSGQGVTLSSYQLKPLSHREEGCKISERSCPKNGVSSSEQNEAENKAVTSPISQESYASKLLIIDPPVSVANKSGTHRPTKPKWKDSCFLKLDDEELAMPRDIKNDPRPLLRYHINRLLRATGWLIGRRKRNSKYNGIGEYVYKSPGGRPIREFHRAWCMCGQNLLTDAISFKQTGDYVLWADMTELWTDLSHTVKEIDDKLSPLESTSDMAHLWCLLDPFANVVFIDKTIRLLKEGIPVKAKKSSVVPADDKSAAKQQEVSGAERSLLDPNHLQDWGYDSTNPFGACLFDVPIRSGAPLLLRGAETVQDCSTSSPSFNLAKNGQETGFGYSRKAQKKSRKISEMKLKNIAETCHFPGSGSKKSKTCRLNDDDLLISAIIKTKTCKATNKWSTCRSKPQRKRKTPKKGSCRLLPRSAKKGAKHIIEGRWSAVGSRTVLSWLIHSGVLSLNEVIQYRNLKDDTVIKDGLITRDGIICMCCNNVLSISEFKWHSGFRLDRPCMNLFMESGKPFTLYQLEAWSAEYKARKAAPQADQVDEIDQNDDSCGRCGDVGELICCDNCPSAFHQACLFEQDLPEGDWYCPQCRCQICGNAVNDKETSQLHGSLNCSQCENKYHETCMQQKGMKVALPRETWFCGDSCNKVYMGLQSRIGLKNHLSDGFSWSLLRCIPGDHKVHSAQRSVALRAECNSKLAVAITIMEECFLPMVDIKTGIDMIPQVIYNWGSQFARLNYNGFYTVVLEKDDVVLSVASIRIHGVTVAELPLVATCSKNRRQGMCRRLINSIEELLKSLKVEKLLVSAIPTLVDTWTDGFGFQPLEEEERQSLSKVNLMVFPGSVWLKKQLYENHTDERTGSCDDFILESSEVGAYEGALNTGEAHLCDVKLSLQEDDVETRICCGDPHSLQGYLECNNNHPVEETNITTTNTNGESENVGCNDQQSSFDEPGCSNNCPVEETNIITTSTNGESENVGCNNQQSRFDELGCGNNAPIEEASILVQSREGQQHSIVFLNELSEQSLVQDCDNLYNPVLKVSSSDELVSLQPVEVVCGAEPEEMRIERQTVLST